MQHIWSGHRRGVKSGEHAQTHVFPKPNTGGLDDPKWLLENTTLDQIEAMLASVVPAINAIAVNREMGAVVPLFTSWEIQLAISLDTQYVSKTLRGYYDRPLSGKQLFYLYKFYERVAADTANILASGDP